MEEWDQATLRLVDQEDKPRGNPRLTESCVPRTTMDIIRTRSDELHLFAYDTPGLTRSSQFFYQFREGNWMRALTVKKAAAPRSLLLSCHSCLFIGSFVRLTTNSNETVYTFLSEHISLQVCDRETSNEFFLRQHGVTLRPVLDAAPTPRRFTTHALCLKGQMDLQIEGLGFLCFYGPQKGEREASIDLPEGVGFALRQSVVRTDLENSQPVRRGYVPKTRVIRQLHRDRDDKIT